MLSITSAYRTHSTLLEVCRKLAFLLPAPFFIYYFFNF
nr:MAG TPA: hypothetical protein [Caudoviricetes sp.]